MNLSALILAGGKSTRMGCDKAWLEIDGQPLLMRQISLARQSGIEKIYISGRSGIDYSRVEYPVLKDEFLDVGPLAGIERGLAAIPAGLLLVLAVDLPLMESQFLTRLAGYCEEGRGAVPALSGQLEPLAAIYPKEAHSIAVHLLANGRYAAKDFVKSCREAGLLGIISVEPGDERLFRNLNSPEACPSDKQLE